MTFNYIETIKQIRQSLINEGYPEYSEAVLDRQLSGATASEIILGVGSLLLEIKKKDSEVYGVIENDAIQFIDYANSIGLYPR